MKRTSTLQAAAVTLAAVLSVLALAALGASAQGPQPQGAPFGAPSPLAVSGQLLGAAISYQGRLYKNGAPVTGQCDLAFRLYDDANAGAQVGQAISATVSVAGGLFVAALDFGSFAFNGEARWLDIMARCPSGSGDFGALTPRQSLLAAPYALALPGMRTVPTATDANYGNVPNLIGGYVGNVIAGGVGSVIGGGGSGYTGRNLVGSSDDFAVIGGGSNNLISGTNFFGTIGGGSSNQVSGQYGTVSGGGSNYAGRTPPCNQFCPSQGGATVGGGLGNSALDGYATVGGGTGNQAGSTTSNSVLDGVAATVGGGDNNRALSSYSFIGGGNGNQIGDDSFSNMVGEYAVIGGGASNWVTRDYAVISGGLNNTATGTYAAVAGGRSNHADGDYSFAGGRRAIARNTGSFVWADSNDYDFYSRASNTFSVRATNGVSLVVSIDANGDPDWTCRVSNGSTWTCSSDRFLKTDIEPVNEREVLQRLRSVPIATWRGRDAPANERHMGPMAQDFYAAFGLGEDDRAISTIDLDGVSLAAIQGLSQMVDEQEAQIAALKAQVAQQQAQMTALEQRLAAIERALKQAQTAPDTK